MSYLDLVNNILKRLRERTVSSINESSYSSLIAVLLNDAKETVENSWNWSGLRTTLTATTSNGIFNYELNGSQNSLTILDVINVEENIFLKPKGSHEFNRFFLSDNVGTGSPYWYSYNGISSDGDTQVDFYPIPDGVYTIRFNCVLRTGDLTEDADTLSVPSKPIELLAYALAVEERGEDGGANPVSAYARANNALQDAITLDSNKHSEELVWYES
tara:strand:+ start:321 stop:968 length:648 start_codon:yes stop_codon:yes gene_type:complete